MSRAARSVHLVGLPGPDAASRFRLLLSMHLHAEQLAHAEATARLTGLISALDAWNAEAEQEPTGPTDEWLTVQQAAARLGLHPDTVRARLKAGTLLGLVDGRTMRVRLSAVAERS